MVCRRSCYESESELDSWTQSAVAQLPFIDSNMSQKAPVHIVPKITSNQQNSQPFYSVTSLDSVTLNSFFHLHYTSATPLKLMDLFGYNRERDNHCGVQETFYQRKDLTNYYYLVTGKLVFC